jgi:hypothetical protein
MTAKTLLTYEAWNTETSDAPPRSRLYPLTPVGIGTLSVESLTSYTRRLAEAHCVSVDTLFTRLLVPSTKKSASSAGIKRALTPSFQLRSRALNGTGVMSAEWVRALEMCTLRKDLRFLTMLSWADVISQRDLFRSIRAWCPMCYERRRAKGHAVYDPLIWELEVFTICPEHGQPLQLRCPYCDRTLPILDRRSKPGHCSKCGEWLGLPSSSFGGRDLEPEELKWQTWIAGALGEIFAAALDSSLTGEAFPPAISRCIDQVAAGNLSKFAALIGKQKTTVWGWQKGNARMSLIDLLNVCYCMDVSVLHLLTSEWGFMKPGGSLVQLRGPFNRSPRSPRIQREFDSDRVHQVLKAILDNEYPPPSMRAVAERMGYDARFLSRKFADLCHAVSVRFAQFQKRCRDQRIQQCREEVREAALKLLSEGSYPSRRRVSQFLKRPSDIERKEAYRVLREINKGIAPTQR